MKDSWSHGDDRRDRGRVARGVSQPRRSRSPPTRRSEGDRESKARERGSKAAPISDYNRPRERSRDRRRRSQDPIVRDSGEEARGRNRGKELLDDRRGSDRPKRSEHQSPAPAPAKRRTSRSPSPSRSKKSKRYRDRSPRREDRVGERSRHERRTREESPLPPRRGSIEREDYRGRHHRDSEYSDTRSYPSGSKHDKPSRSSYHKDTHRSSHRTRSRTRSPGSKRRRESFADDSRPRRHNSPTYKGDRRKSPKSDSRKHHGNSRPSSRAPPRDLIDSRGVSPTPDTRGRPREEYRHPKAPKSRQPGNSNPNTIEVSTRRSSTPTASGANSIEVKTDKMANRGFYSQGYTPNQQMQAAFPLKPQYNQVPQVDPRQYSQSPQHSHHSYQSSPQVQSPYHAGRGNWNGQQQYSPQP